MFSATFAPDRIEPEQKVSQESRARDGGSKDLSANANIEQRVEVLTDNRARLAALLRDYHKTRKNRVMVFALCKKEKKLDANHGAFTKDIDPNAKATKVTFGNDDD